MPSKLHLKRTPEEVAARALRKAKKADKAARKQAKSERKRYAPEYIIDLEEPASSGQRKRPRTTVESEDDNDDDDDAYGPPPPPSVDDTQNVDYNVLRAQLEEERFREKMCGAFDDDERLDSLEARMNDYACIPERWRDTSQKRGKRRVYTGEDEYDKVDPTQLDEEEYAEWVRKGMYRRTHAAEYAANLEKEAFRAARRAEEKTAKAEAARLEATAEETRRRRRAEKSDLRRTKARQIYEERWKNLLDLEHQDHESLSFTDIPWPVFPSSDQITLADITGEAISTFLLPPEAATLEPVVDDAAISKRRLATLRLAMLRFHPDKFEGRIMGRVRKAERAHVGEAINIVVRGLSELMKAETK